MCFSNIERQFVGTKTQNYCLKSVCNFKVTRFYLILLCKQYNWTLCTNIQLRKLHIILKGATLNSLKISEMSPHDSRMHACLLLATHLLKTGHKILGIIFLIFFACALSHYRVMTVICDIEISGKSQNYCLKSVCNFNVTRFYSILLCKQHNWSYENRVSKQFVTSLNFPCLIAFILTFVQKWLHVGRISRISIYPPPAPLLLHSLYLFFVCFVLFLLILPTILYSTQVTVI